MELILFLLFSIAVAIGGSWLFHVAGKKKSHRLLREWAGSKGIELIEIEEPLFDAGPFTLRCSKVHRVFRIRVRAGSGEKVLWVRLGHWLLGLLRPEVTVEEEPIQASETTRGK